MTEIGNTLWLAGWVVAFSLAIGTPLAFAITRTSLPCRGLATSLIAALLFVPLYLQAAAWQAVWGVRGWLTTALNLMPLADWPAVIWIHTAAAVPWVILIVGLGLERVEPELEEDALLDASPWKVFLRVTLRRSLVAIAAAALWVAVYAAGEMTVTDLYQIRTLAEVTYQQYAATIDLGQATQGVLGATAAITACLALAMTAAIGRMSIDRHVGSRLRWLFPMSRSQWLVNLFAWCALGILIGAPLVGLVDKAGIVVTRSETGWQRDWSPTRAASLIVSSPRRFEQELKWSLIIGATAATAATIVGFPLVWNARRNHSWRLAVITITAFALVAPGPLVGVGLIKLFHLGDWPWLWYLYDRTIAAPALAQFLKALPLAMLVLGPAVWSVPQELLDSAAVDGAGQFALLWRVVLPVARRALAVAWLVALAVSVGDLAASILVLPPGVETLANRIFGLLHYGVDDQVAGISLFMFGMFVLTGITVRRLTRPWYH